ncbi:MAG: hypothetical protein JXA82_17410, partial [Sedimentisphaerales bacterium]|nr:hypothetical protein [Sedimentisphaerales bacterium]
WSQCREMMLLALTHNIAIILLVNELFYRALSSPFNSNPVNHGSLSDKSYHTEGNGQIKIFHKRSTRIAPKKRLTIVLSFLP